MGTGGQLGWVACSHMLEHGSLVSPLNVGPGCIPHLDQTSWVTWGYGYRWTSFAGWPVTIRWIVAAWCFPWRELTRLPPPRWARLTGWPGAMVAGWPAKLVGLPPYDTAKEACVMDGGTGCQTHVGLDC